MAAKKKESAPDLMEVTISGKEDGAIYGQYFFDQRSDNVLEFENLYTFIKNNRGEFDIEIRHFTKN